MASTKALLKTAREAITCKDFDTALGAATKVISLDPGNYNGYVFAGLANLNLRNEQAAEDAYKNAIAINPNQLLAWQGLANFYEKVKNWPLLSQTLYKLIYLYRDAADHQKCYDTLQKYIHIASQHGSRREFIDALRLELPSSTWADFLENLPPALSTLRRIVQLMEEEEQEHILKEIEVRRKRLNAGTLEQVTRNVKMEVFSNSDLENMYEEILDYSNDDEERKEFERKLLEHRYESLQVVPLNEKPTILKSLREMARGMVFLSKPELLAWTIKIEWEDVETIEDYDESVLQRFIGVFPSEGLSNLMQAYYKYRAQQGHLIPKPVDKGDDDHEIEEEEGPEALDLAIDGYDQTIQSIFAQRVMSYIYFHERDYTSAKDFAAEGMKLVKQIELDFGIELPKSQRSFQLITAQAYLHIQRPKYLPQAHSIFAEILVQEPNHIEALRGQGLYYKFMAKYSEALVCFEKITTLSPDDIEARSELAWVNVLQEDYNRGGSDLEELICELEGDDTRISLRATLWYRLGVCKWKSNVEKRRDRSQCFNSFVQCLKLSPSYAAAFTSLGLFYEDIESDQTRAFKCFQKAFELDVKEVMAARRLARHFANTNDWDLVEMIVRKVIDSGAAGSKFAGASNAWAWKALGLVELNGRKYGESIQAFQTALRVESSDVQSWIGLGEGYFHSGRYTSALKAFNQANKMQPGNQIALYSIGRVQMRLGLHQESVKTFGKLQGSNLIGVVAQHSLLRAHLEWTAVWINAGFYGRASESVISILKITAGMDLDEDSKTGSIWKIVGDAMILAERLPAYVRQDSSNVFNAFLHTLEKMESNLQDGLKVFPSFPTISDVRDTMKSKDYVKMFSLIATAAYRLALLLPPVDGKIVAASSWYDLGVAYRRIHFVCKPKEALSFAIQCFKEALKLEVGNSLFWNALGVSSFAEDNASVATHAFIKSMEMNPRNAQPWSNLGYLYLSTGDLELAYAAFTRAQSLDPEDAHVWLGHSLLSKMSENIEQARNLNRHAVEISGASIPAANLSYAMLAFESKDFLLPLYAMEKVLEQKPNDAHALNMYAIFCERTGDLDRARDSFLKASDILEAQYAIKEDPVIEYRYAITKSSAGRVQVALGEFDAAVSNLEDIQELLEEQNDQILQLTSMMSLGLAYFFLDRLEESLTVFEKALEIEHSGNAELRILLSQILWALEGTEQRETAKSQLFDCIQENPGFLGAILKLYAIGLLEGDEVLIDAAGKEITADLLCSQEISEKALEEVETLRIANAQLEGDGKRAIAIASDALYRRPFLPKAKMTLCKLLLQAKHECMGVIGEMVAHSNRIADGPADEISEGYRLQSSYMKDKDDAKVAAQRAIIAAPWDIQSWECLITAS